MKISRSLQIQIELEDVPALEFLWLLLHIEVICLVSTKKSERQKLNKVSTTKLNSIAETLFVRHNYTRNFFVDCIRIE